MEAMRVVIESAWRAAIISELKTRQMSRSDFARMLQVSPQYVTDRLNGRKPPGSEVMEKWLSVLGLRPVLSFEPIEAVVTAG
jgi:transcriptional regulator with XRE-family HTH domain